MSLLIWSGLDVVIFISKQYILTFPWIIFFKKINYEGCSDILTSSRKDAHRPNTSGCAKEAKLGKCDCVDLTLKKTEIKKKEKEKEKAWGGQKVEENRIRAQSWMSEKEESS